MSNERLEKSNKWVLAVRAGIIFLAIAGIFMAVFAAAMYFFELDKNLSSLFATLSVAAGSLFTAYYVSGKIGSKGYLNGLAIGGIIFIIITLISLIVDQGGITVNTLFHFSNGFLVYKMRITFS